jgi:hypothetical protein
LFRQPRHLHNREADANGQKRTAGAGSCVTTSDASRGRLANRTRRRCRRDLDLLVPGAGIGGRLPSPRSAERTPGLAGQEFGYSDLPGQQRRPVVE